MSLVDTTADEAAPERAVYTVKETAAVLSLSLGSVYALVRTGRIPAVQLGGRWVVPKQRLHQWLNDQADHGSGTAGGAR